MSEKNKNPFVQTNLGSAVVGGLIVAALTAAFGVVVHGLPGWVILLFAAGTLLLVALIFSLANRQWRATFWGSIGRSIKWFFAIRWFTTRKQKKALVDSGYAARSKEIGRERAAARKPDFWIEKKSPGFYVIRNRGWWVTDVWLSAPEEEFEFESVHSWPKEQFGDDTLGSHSGKTFDGNPTAKGRADGVTFAVDWLDRNGDPDHADLPFSPPALPPVVRAVWEIAPHPSKGGTWAIVNHAKGSVAKRVHLEPIGSPFVVMRSGADWGEIKGGDVELFAAKPLDAAKMLGGQFLITWLDQNNEEQKQPFQLPPLGAGFGML